MKAIIRLYTIRKVGDGFGFDIRSTYLRTENTDLRQQLNLNYRVNGWDLFGTLKYERYAYLQESVIKQTTYVDTLWTQENSLRVDGISNPLTAVLGVNYEFSPEHQAGIKYTLGTYPGNNGATARTTSDVYANGDYYDRWVSKDEQHQEFLPRHRVNGYYSGTFGELTVDFNGDLFHGSQTQGSTITESSEEYDDRFIESSNRVKNQLVATRTILTHPLWGGSLSFGNEYTRTRRNEDYHTSNPVIPSSNTAIHDQNLAFFTEYSRTTPIGQFTAGIRYENVHWDYFNNGERNDEQSRKYTRWFPGFTYNHTLGNVQTQLSYSVKTIRPTYWQLGSNIFYANRFTMQKGNPFLKPSILHDVSLMSSWRFLQLAVSYKNEKDLIIHWAEQLEDNPAVTILSLINIKEMPSLSAFLTASPKVGIWSPQASIGISSQWLAMEIRGQQVSMNRPTFMASFNNSFTLPNGFLLTVDSRFRGKGFYQNFRNTHNEFVVNAGITKTFMEDRLAVTLKGHDIFHGQKWGIHAYNDRIEINQFNQWDTQELELTVRYTFNTTHSRYKGNGAGDREIGRM